MVIKKISILQNIINIKSPYKNSLYFVQLTVKLQVSARIKKCVGAWNEMSSQRKIMNETLSDSTILGSRFWARDSLVITTANNLPSEILEMHKIYMIVFTNTDFQIGQIL